MKVNNFPNFPNVTNVTKIKHNKLQTVHHSLKHEPYPLGSVAPG
jgi:hypothetical protein